MRMKHTVLLLSVASFGVVVAGCSDDDDVDLNPGDGTGVDLNPGDGSGVDLDPGEGSGLPGDAGDEGTDAPDDTTAMTVVVETTVA